MGNDSVVEQRYEFLEKLHTALQPRGYVEIGVQAGGSLALAQCDSVGIDPLYQVQVPLQAYHRLRINTSDDYFAMGVDNGLDLPNYVDFAFIDGMHLVEYAIRDFTYIEKYAHKDTVVVFDDVLPYNAAIATRAQPPGDWTGDVWKVIPFLEQYRNDLTFIRVNTHPTGSLVVTGFGKERDMTGRMDFSHEIDALMSSLMEDIEPPHWVLNREGAVSQEEAIEMIMRGRS